MRLFACLVLLLAACTAGEIDLREDEPPAAVDADGVEVDAGGEGEAVDAGDEEGVVDAAAPVEDEPDAYVETEPCVEPVETTDPGKHYDGLACMSCHGPGGGAPRFSLAGTLYDGPQSTTGLPGATITLVDANGEETRLITALNGNFYTRKQLTYPLTVKASRCPTTRSMVMKVPEPGNCNSCHTGVDLPRAHLPAP